MDKERDRPYPPEAGNANRAIHATASELGAEAGAGRNAMIDAPAGFKPWAEISIEEKIERLREHARNHAGYFDHLHIRLAGIGSRLSKLGRHFYYHSHKGEEQRPVVPAEEHELGLIGGEERAAKNSTRARGTLD
jgi:hypothetical protein